MGFGLASAQSSDKEQLSNQAPLWAREQWWSTTYQPIARPSACLRDRSDEEKRAVTASENELKPLVWDEKSPLSAGEAVLGPGFVSGRDGFRSP